MTKEQYQALRKHTTRYGPTRVYPWVDLGLTLLAIAVLWFLKHAGLPLVLYLIFQVLLTTKAFIIYHDLGHNSYFRDNRWNKRLRLLLSPLTWTPRSWLRSHGSHHRVSGNTGQDEYNWSDTIYLTVRKFHQLSPSKKLACLVFRNPVVFFLLGSFFIWFIRFRIPVRNLAGLKYSYDPTDIMICNAGVLLILALVYWIGGWAFCLAYIGSFWILSVVGLMLFHLQHAFNPAYVRPSSDSWSFDQAAILGSSILQIPPFLRWFTGGIEYHHLHHFDMRVPGYHLRRCHEDAMEKFPLPSVQIGAREALRCLRYTLYDEERDRFVSFRSATLG